MVASYPIHEAKARFSELIRRAEAGEEVVITRHGREVARLRPPTAPTGESLEERLARLEREGVLGPDPGPFILPEAPAVRVPGALERFLADRD